MIPIEDSISKSTTINGVQKSIQKAVSRNELIQPIKNEVQNKFDFNYDESSDNDDTKDKRISGRRILIFIQ